MAEIPGYYYDEEKNRHFKIMPTGPYSLASINQKKREREREQEQQQQQQQQLRSKKRQHPMDTSSILEFHRQRSLLPSVSLRSMVGYGAKSIFKQLTHVGSVSLSFTNHNEHHLAGETPLPPVDNMAVNITTCGFDQQVQQNGGAILVSQRGLVTRYGFQVSPTFEAWTTSSTWYCGGSNTTSLHFGRPYISQQEWNQTVIGTSIGQDPRHPNRLWRSCLLLDTPTLGSSLLPQPFVVASFTRQKDTFWSSFVGDEHDITLVGGERQLYILNANFNLVSKVASKSAIFTTHLVEHQPQLAWIGRRDGRIILVDTRENNTSHCLQFYTSSAVTHLKPLAPYSSGHALLAAAMDGSLSLLDTRFCAPSSSSSTTKGRDYNNNNKKHTLSKPLRQFYGHTNDHSRNLAFDVDLNLKLMAMAGNDNVIRLWSLEDQDNEVHPFWSSNPYSGQISQAAILSSVVTPKDATKMPLMKRSNPGLLVCAPTPSFDWYSLP